MPLLNHLVGASEQRGRHGEAKRFTGLEIDRQLELGRFLHRQVSWLLALEDPVDVAGDTDQSDQDHMTSSHRR